MESDDNMVNDNHGIGIKKEIKNDFPCDNEILTEFKSEYAEINEFHHETVFVSSHLIKECGNSKINGSEMCNKTKIKEEPCWPESTSSEVKQEEELSFAEDADMKNEIKDPVSDTEVITGDIGAEETSRFHSESICRNSDSTFSFHTGTCSEESRWKNSDYDIAQGSKLLISSQPHMSDAPPTDSKMDSNSNGSLVKSISKTHTCEKCGKSFRFLNLLKSHMLSHAEKKLYKCEICGKNFPKPSKLRQHQLIHEGKKPHTCEICNRSFTQASTCKQHKLTHGERKLYTCDICNQSFRKVSYLAVHKLIHEGRQPPTCEICNKSFLRKSHLTLHKLCHQFKNPSVCEICNKSFTLASRLRKHKFIHDRPYTCDVCDKKFAEKSRLKNHRLIHEGKSPHTCEICLKGYSTASTLKKHELLHNSKEHKI